MTEATGVLVFPMGVGLQKGQLMGVSRKVKTHSHSMQLTPCERRKRLDGVGAEFIASQYASVDAWR